MQRINHHSEQNATSSNEGTWSGVPSDDSRQDQLMDGPSQTSAEEAKAHSLVDNRYIILERFGDDQSLMKQVYLVRDTHRPFSKPEILKIYTFHEQGAFVAEYQRNLALLDSSPYTIKMSNFVAAYKDMPAFKANGQLIDFYSYITIPLAEKGTLLNLLMKANEKKYQMSFQLKLYLITQLVESVNFLHMKNGLAHLDLKPDNIVLSDDYRIQLIDFGPVEKLNQLISHSTGTDRYMAPEVRKTLTKNNMVYIPEKADIFSLGVNLFIILMQKMPFAVADPSDPYFRMIMQDKFCDFYSVHQANGYPVQLLRVIWEALNCHSPKRPLAKDLHKSIIQLTQQQFSLQLINQEIEFILQ